eukprot:5350383-Amphidinium_carterae.2
MQSLRAVPHQPTWTKDNLQQKSRIAAVFWGHVTSSTRTVPAAVTCCGCAHRKSVLRCHAKDGNANASRS